MLLDEWHLQVEVPSSISQRTQKWSAQKIVNRLLVSFGERLEAPLRAAKIADVEVIISR